VAEPILLSKTRGYVGVVVKCSFIIAKMKGGEYTYYWRWRYRYYRGYNF